MSALCHRETLEPERFAVHTANCLLHKLETFNAKPATCQKSQTLGMHSQIDLSTKKAPIVSKEIYGLSAEFYGLQRFIELGIKNNTGCPQKGINKKNLF